MSQPPQTRPAFRYSKELKTTPKIPSKQSTGGPSSSGTCLEHPPKRAASFLWIFCLWLVPADCLEATRGMLMYRGCFKASQQPSDTERQAHVPAAPRGWPGPFAQRPCSVHAPITHRRAQREQPKGAGTPAAPTTHLQAPAPSQASAPSPPLGQEAEEQPRDEPEWAHGSHHPIPCPLFLYRFRQRMRGECGAGEGTMRGGSRGRAGSPLGRTETEMAKSGHPQQGEGEGE